jgi:hypothetical protein
MKKWFFTGWFLFLLASGRAQLLTVTPGFPSDSSTVSIVVDCSKGNQGLYNYASTSDVYVHVGVITSMSTNQTDWRYVPFTWGTTNPLAQASSLGNNRYQYTINNIRQFFAVPAAEIIIKIAILFRNGSGSLAQRNSDGTDMFVPVYAGGLGLAFTQPPFQPTYNPVPEPITKNLGDNLAIKLLSSHAAGLNLFFNGALVDSALSADSLSVPVTITRPGNQVVLGTANDGTHISTDSFNFYVASASSFLPLPPGAREGINYMAGDTSVILVLFAPLKNKMLVVGDFNGWTQEPAYQMNRTPDSNYFWIQVNGLTPGAEYAYQYVMDDTLILADYNTEKVLDKNVDPSIPASTYPNLKAFPSGASGTLAGIIQTAQSPYVWQFPQFQRPDKKNLMIYELWLADFTASGNWQGLIDTLGYLKHLGVNAVEIEPFNNFEGNPSWGYNPNFYFAPDKVYGTSTAVKQFVDACHQQGMAVIMDLVMNHSFGSSPMVQMYWNNALGVPAANNPWFNSYPTHAFNVGYQFNHESPATVNFTRRVINYWLTNYHIDGYRWDLAKGFTQTRTCDAFGNNCDVNAWGAYDAGRVATWDTIYNQMQAASPSSYCILEMFADNSEQSVEANYGMMLWGEDLNTTYNQATMGYSSPSPGGATWDLTGSIYTALGGWNNPGLIVYQESHDDERLMHNNEQYGNTSGNYRITDTTTGLKRDAMSTVFWGLAPGPKMLTEFGELGFDYSINWCTNGTVDPSGSCRLTPKPIRWDYLKDSSRKQLHDVYSGLMQLRAAYPGLATGETKYSLGGPFKYLQVISTGLSALTMGNFDVVNTTGSVSFGNAGTWYDYFSGQTIQATGNLQSFNLAPGEYHLYVNQNINHIDTLIRDTTGTGGTGSGMYLKVFPNPVTGSGTTISYQLPEAGDANLTVYSSNGQQVGLLDLGYHSAGQYNLQSNQLPFNPFSLSGGYYVLKLICGSRSAHLGFLVVHH